MNWYIAKIVYRIICGDGNHKPQFDEQLRLISARDEQQAFRKAQNIGKHEDDCFLNNINKPVHWKFIDIAEIILLDELTDGAEIYSKITEEDNAEGYIHTIRLRAKQLSQNNTYNLLASN